MKKYFTRKIVPGLLIVAFILPSFSFLKPRTAEAQWAVFDAGNIVQNTITAVSSTASSFSTYSMQYKEFVLDGLAGMFAKQIIRQLTQSVVNWINSGFEGSPSFVTNPSSFFLDIADQETGRFLSQYGGPLAELCTPFSIDLRIALAFKYRPNAGKRYSCTIGTIIRNSENAIENASINGFTAGDFRQGGWPAFISLTTEPQNNIYGAWLQADADLSLKVANFQFQRREELNQGKGFLSWRKCTQTTAAGAAQGSELTSQNLYAGPGGGELTGGELYAQPGGAPEKCEVQTPGSVIVSALESNVNGPLHELQLADEFNEIVNALFAQLVKQVLEKGLGGVSGSGTGDPDAYINQIAQESSEGLKAIVDQMLPNLETYIENTRKYKANKDASLSAIVDAKLSYDTAKACYQAKTSTTSTLSDYHKALARIEITQIDSEVSRDVSPISTQLLAGARSADARLKSLLDIQASTTVAKTVNDLRIPSEKYSQMLQNQTLISPVSIQQSKEELDQVKITAEGIKQNGQRKIQECILFPANRP